MTSASRGGSLIGKIGSYLQIVAKDPSSTAFVPLAEAYRQIGLLDDALEAARLGTKMLPHFSPGFSTMGRILGQMGRIDEAMSAYARALSIDRQSQSALVGLARLHLIRGERDLARNILQQAEGFHPDDEKIADMLVALDLPRPWKDIKQSSQAQEPPPKKEVLPSEPAEPIPTATLAEIYAQQGLLDKAARVYENILQQNPENAKARERLLQLQESLGGKPVLLTAAAADEPATLVVTQQAAAEEDLLETTPTSPPLQGAIKDQSPLEVLQRWLTAIKQGRANVQ
jgi:tetratricopeptide (TPR) repeat protein